MSRKKLGFSGRKFTLVIRESSSSPELKRPKPIPQRGPMKLSNSMFRKKRRTPIKMKKRPRPKKDPGDIEEITLTDDEEAGGIFCSNWFCKPVLYSTAKYSSDCSMLNIDPWKQENDESNTSYVTQSELSTPVKNLARQNHDDDSDVVDSDVSLE